MAQAVEPIPILHSDPHLVVVDKPAGCLVVHAPGRQGMSLVDRVSKQLGERLFPVHRLDEDTTGTLLLARTAAARAVLEDLFREHAIEREYLALVRRRPDPQSGRIESYLAEDRHGVMRSMTARGAGERAVTEYRILESRPEGYLLLCRLETGKRNQIRAHLAELGCPIVGDRKYGWRAPRSPGTPGVVRRPLLHAFRLAFAHPVSGERVDVRSLAPEAELRPGPDAPASR